MLQMQDTRMQGHPDSFSTHIQTGLLPLKPGMRLALAPTYHLFHTGTEMGKWVQGQPVPLLEALAVQSIYRSSLRRKFLLFQQPTALPSPSQHCLTAFRPFFHHLAASTGWVPIASNTSSD